MTAVGIPARPVKKDGISIPKEKKHASVEEYEELREEVKELREQVRILKEALETISQEKKEI